MINAHLLGRVVYGKYTESPTVYLTGFDSNRDISVCIAVVDKTTPADAASEYELAWSWTFDYNFMVERNDEWLVGLAYVDCTGEFDPLQFPDEELAPMRITPAEYAAIRAEAT
jgi:hypothetical protein